MRLAVFLFSVLSCMLSLSAQAWVSTAKGCRFSCRAVLGSVVKSMMQLLVTVLEALDIHEVPIPHLSCSREHPGMRALVLRDF